MDQKKIGSLLRELRKEKGLTQEQLAEQFGVSNRTVSRWENGSNMPDLSLLVEIADYYDVEIREILDGERKSENMMKEEKETLLKIADYAEKEKEIILNRICAIDIVGLLVMAVAIIIEMCDLGIASVFIQNMKDCMYGFGMGVILTNILYLTGVLSKIRENKVRRTTCKIIAVIAITIVVICLGISLLL